ncbi:MAG: DMT family transporter [Promethearchaeota archaeon]
MESDKESDNKYSPTISKISMLIAAILMGNVGLVVSLLSDYPAYTITLLRGIGGTLFLTLFMLKFHSFSKDFLKESFKLHWKHLLILGIMNPIIIGLYFLAIIISGYAIAAFLLYTGGIFVICFLIIGKVEKVSKINILGFILAIIGVAIIMEFWTGQALSYGVLIGILSGITYAIFMFCTKKIYIYRNNNISKITTKGDIDILIAWFSTFFIIVLSLPLGILDLFKLDLTDWLYVLILGLIPTALPFILFNIGLKNDKGGNILILSYFEPVVATINGIFFQQIFSIYTIIGGALILIANIIVLFF